MISSKLSSASQALLARRSEIKAEVEVSPNSEEVESENKKSKALIITLGVLATAGVVVALGCIGKIKYFSDIEYKKGIRGIAYKKGTDEVVTGLLIDSLESGNSAYMRFKDGRIVSSTIRNKYNFVRKTYEQTEDGKLKVVIVKNFKKYTLPLEKMIEKAKEDAKAATKIVEKFQKEAKKIAEGIKNT